MRNLLLFFHLPCIGQQGGCALLCCSLWLKGPLMCGLYSLHSIPLSCHTFALNVDCPLVVWNKVHAHTHLVSAVPLVFGCNFTLDLRNQLTRLGFRAFVLLLAFEGVCWMLYLPMLLCSAAMAHDVLFTLTAFSPLRAKQWIQFYTIIYTTLHHCESWDTVLHRTPSLSTMSGHSELFCNLLSI